MLLFLSDVKFFNGVARPTTYQNIGQPETTETTNESAVRYLAKIKKVPPNKIFYFASTKVQGNIDGKEISHVDYFKNRIKEDVVGDIEDVMIPCYFDEKADVQSTMDTVTEMAKKIQDYISTLQEGTEVTLHVDMTGGMRHASLMMLIITRLIQYSGVKIGNILYSNFYIGKVEESNEIYKLFDLIAGAEEFVRFGSVDAIKSYFEKTDEVPKVLQDLLGAMGKFAEVIKISRRSEFQKALESLQEAYKKFSEDAENLTTVKDVLALNYKLMQQLKIRISQEYAALLKNQADDYLSIINWCLEHDYLQQALTLYTECFPYLIFTKDKMVTVEPSVLDDVNKKSDKDSMKREWEFFLLNEYTPRDYHNIFKAYENFINHELKEHINLIKSGTFDMDAFKDNFDNWKIQGIIESDFETYLKLLQDLQKLKSAPNLATDLDTVAENLPTLYFFRDLIPEDIFKKPLEARPSKILKNCAGILTESFMIKNKRTQLIHFMIFNGMLNLNIDDEEIFLKIIERYFTIKNERNNSAHARLIPKETLRNSDSEISYAELLKGYMKQGLQEYAEACKKIKKF